MYFVLYILIADQSRHDYIVTGKAKVGEKFTFYIEAACNGMFGVGANDAMVADPNRYFDLSKADLVVPNKATQSLYHDLTYVFPFLMIIFDLIYQIIVLYAVSLSTQIKILLVLDRHYG